MKLAIHQSEPVPADTDQGLSRLSEGIARAAAHGADLVVAPEMALSGYMIGAEACERLAEPRGGAFHQAVAAMAREHKIAVAYGYPEGTEGGVFNAAELVDATGKALLNYAKTHLWSDIDRSQFIAGGALSQIVAFGNWRIALAICYDIEFPEVARALRLAGANLILVPTASAMPYLSAPQRIVPTRAEENAMFIAYANYAGEEQGSQYAGHSCIVGPDGEDLARAGATPELIVADLDLSVIDRRGAEIPYLADRRPDLYPH
ncbi:carbon-nitrogen hydrolase family protein [Rhodobacteraceae bacterium NNCM2]|nr:carbon-nitrogen hydrolase family protein [Coraliihabitans acroporae]